MYFGHMSPLHNVRVGDKVEESSSDVSESGLLVKRCHLVIIHLLSLVPEGWLASPYTRALRGWGSAL
jgi:hypothetical protein